MQGTRLSTLKREEDHRKSDIVTDIKKKLLIMNMRINTWVWHYTMSLTYRVPLPAVDGVAHGGETVVQTTCRPGSSLDKNTMISFLY